MRSLIEGYLRLVDKLVEALARLAQYFVIAVTAWVTFAVVMRYVFKNPLIIGIDVAIMMAMFTYYLPIAFDVKYEIHPTLSFVTNRMNRTAQHVLQLITLGIYIWLGTLWTVNFWGDMLRMLSYKVPIEMMPYVPIGWVRVPMVLGMGAFVILCVTYFGLTIRNLVKGRQMDYSPPLTLKEAVVKVIAEKEFD